MRGGARISNRAPRGFIGGVLTCMITSTIAGGAVTAAELPSRPNFVFVLGEGQGWNSTSVAMDDRVPESKSDFFYTPSLERLAAEGTRFANFYAPSPRCTPSRATYFTGKSPALLRMTFIGRGRSPGRRLIEPDAVLEMPLEETTIAELLKPAGYATAHFGKWHVGRVPPTQHGFDENDGATSNGGPDNVSNPNPEQAYGITERGLAFMARQVEAGKPFYLQMSHYPGRGIDDARRETVEKLLRRPGGRDDRSDVGAAAVALDVDITIGMILDKIDELGIAGNTYVIYTTDHGTPGRANGPLALGKGTVWEGGIRVPLLMRGPGIQAGAVARVQVTGADLFPTLAELAHRTAEMPADVEGGSLVPVLTGSSDATVRRPREELVFHFPHYDSDPLGPTSAMLLDQYKLIHVYETGTRYLFDLESDRGEQHDLAGAMPDKVAELDHRLSEYLKSVNAQVPSVNPDFDPTQPVPETARRGGRRRGGRGEGGGRRRNRDQATESAAEASEN